MPLSSQPQAAAPCTVCGGTDVKTFMELRAVPVHCNVLWETKQQALQAPRGDMLLGFCTRCGHVYNVVFDPRLMEYTQAYENSLHFSPRFQAYAEALVDGLIQRHNIRNKTVIDIGCGKGDFLSLVCERGENKGFGFDPSYQPEHMDPRRAERMTIIRDFYSPKYKSYAAELVTCRHVLEHIQHPVPFVGSVREAVMDRPSTVVFWEVPNALFTLKDLGIWDLIYEHCSYFTAPSLARALCAAGLDVTRVEELYEGQFLGIEGRPSPKGQGQLQTILAVSPAEIEPLVDAFEEKYRARVNQWKSRFAAWHAEGKSVVTWGGGSKGVTFLNTLGKPSPIRAVVDLNPRKAGKFVPGTGQEIVSPEALRQIRPDAVIVMNPIYVDEISEHVRSMGLKAEIHLV